MHTPPINDIEGYDFVILIIIITELKIAIKKLSIALTLELRGRNCTFGIPDLYSLKKLYLTLMPQGALVFYRQSCFF